MERAWCGRVWRELRALAASPPPGVSLQLPDHDLSDVRAAIDGPADTPYAGGVFQVRLSLAREFPAAAPRAHFLTRVFHPNVAADTGEVCVSTLSRDWRPELGLRHALLALRSLLAAPNPDSALNAEAAALLRDRYPDYVARARLLTDIHARPGPALPGPAAPGAGPAAPGAGTKRERAHEPGRAPPSKDRRRVLKRL